MSAFLLKLIAVIAMTIDHVGYFVTIKHPEFIWMRVIGRITMPIMSFFIVQGYVHTKNFKKYLLRMGIFAVISHFAYNLCFGEGSGVMTTFFIALICIYCADKTKDRVNGMLQPLFFIVGGLLAEFLTADWGLTGLLIIMVFWFGRDNKKVAFSGIFGVVLFTFLSEFLNAASSGYTINFDTFFVAFIQSAILLAVPLLLTYNGKRGLNDKFKNFNKWLFYAYYPLHLIIIYIYNTYVL